MRKKGLLAVATALVSFGFVTAGAAVPSTSGADVPSTALELAVAGQLPADVTGESGVWNFVGPASACPGPGWNCETLGAGPVVQNGTVNVAQCTGTDCVSITQNGDVNRIECGPDQEDLPNFPEEKTDEIAVQDCGTHTQNGPHNIAIFKLIYDVDQGPDSPSPTQCVLQKGEVTQQNAVTNYFWAQFLASMTLTEGATQTQDARQRLVVNQTATERNESEIKEVQIQDATGDAATQKQNFGCVPATAIEDAGDCNDVSTAPVGPTTPYTCVNLFQRAAPGGVNLSKLKQEVNQDAQTIATPATETQGQPTGGNDARVHQEVGEVVIVEEEEVFVPADTGKSLGLSDQFTYQTLPDGFGGAQSQFEDPFCCGGSQVGGAEGDSEETMKMWVQQQAGPNALQEAHATGVSASSSGPCTVDHHLQNNGGDAQAAQTQDPPCSILGTTTCEGGVEGFCTSTNCPPGEVFSFESNRCEEQTITLTAPAGWSRAL